jgi:peptidoglycan/LPS O-acetylase OafA/YrhL
MSSNSQPEKNPESKPRLTWIDASRVFAALGVVLIHSSTDSDGGAFAAAPVGQRVGPALLRVISELSGAEIFLVLSLFLFAWKLDRRDAGYRANIADQARRLLLPFGVWTVFYAFFRLMKANELGYPQAIYAELPHVSSWVGYGLLGSAQYHLHFMPTLFALVLVYPLLRGAARFPLVGLALLPLIFAMGSVQGWLWGHVTDPMLRNYLDRFVRIVCFSGYGLAGFSMYGVWRRGLDREASSLLFRSAALFTGAAFLATLVYAAEVAKAGRYGVRPDAAFYGHFLMPVLVFACFLGLQHARWPASLSWFAKFTFGVYLIHPIFIDVFDVAFHHLGWKLDPTVMVLLKYVFAVSLSLVVSYAMSEVRFLAWMIGAEKPTPRPKLADASVRAPSLPPPAGGPLTSH